MISNERAVLVVGPGQAFGAELCQALHERECKVATVARHPLSGAITEMVTRHYLADVTDEDPYLRVLVAVGDDFPNLTAVIYNAVARGPRRALPSLEDLVDGAAVSFAAYTTHLALRKPLIAQGGRFIMTGGNFAVEPDPARLVLSMQKVVTHGLALALRADLPNLYEYMIEGEAALQPQVIAEGLADLAVGA